MIVVCLRGLAYGEDCVWISIIVVLTVNTGGVPVKYAGIFS
jgi:hypothetical protein